MMNPYQMQQMQQMQQQMMQLQNQMQQMQQMNQMQPQVQQPQQMQQPAQPAAMSKPTVTATIIQVDNEQEMLDAVQNVGITQLYGTKDGNTFFAKTIHANGEIELDAWDKRKQQAVSSPYVKREEYDALCNEIVTLRTQIAALSVPAPAPAPAPARSRKGDAVNE